MAIKRSRKVVPMKPGGSGGRLTGRDGAIDFATRSALANQAVANPDHHIYRVIELVGSITLKLRFSVAWPTFTVTVTVAALLGAVRRV